MKAFSEESRKPVSVFFGGEHVSCECGAAAPQGAGFFWIIHKTAYRTGKGCRVFLRNEKAGFSVSHDFWQGVDVGGDDGEAEAHGLDDSIRDAIPSAGFMNDAGGKKNVVAADKIRQLIVGNDAREIDKLLEPELLPEIQNCLGHVPV